MNLLLNGRLLDPVTETLIDKDDFITSKNGELQTFNLLHPTTAYLYKRKRTNSHERVIVTKGIRRKESIALGFQRTSISPKEIFKSVRKDFKKKKNNIKILIYFIFLIGKTCWSTNRIINRKTIMLGR